MATDAPIDIELSKDPYHGGRGATACAREWIKKKPAGAWLDVVNVDDRDKNSPDDWVPRHPELVRLTGLHPFNCEPPLTLCACGARAPLPRRTRRAARLRLPYQRTPHSLALTRARRSPLCVTCPSVRAQASSRASSARRSCTTFATTAQCPVRPRAPAGAAAQRRAPAHRHARARARARACATGSI
jgi:hypothetical protein